MSIKGDRRRWVVLDPDKDYGDDETGKCLRLGIKEYCDANHGGAKAIIGPDELKHFATYVSRVMARSKK